MAVKQKSFVEAWSEGLRRLRDRPLPPLTVIAGDADAVKQRLVEAAVAQADGDVEVFAARPGEKDRDALHRLLDLWGTRSLFGGGQLIVVRHADALLKNKGVKLVEAHLTGDAPPANRLLLTVDALDGRSKLAKAVKAQDGLVSLPVLRDSPPPWHDGGPFLETDLNQWTVAEARLLGLELALPVADELTRRIGNEPGRVAQKLRQLAVLLGDRKRATREDVAGFVPFSSVRLLGLYEDALVAGDVRTAMALVDRMVREGVYDPFMRLVSGPAVSETVLRGLSAGLARLVEAHERLGPRLVSALSSKPWQRSKADTAALDEALGRGGRRVFVERDLRRVSAAAALAAFGVALDGLRRLRDGRGLSLHAHTARLARAYGARGTAA